MTIQTYNRYEGITSANLVAILNVSGNYNNGPTNNGVGAYFVIPSGFFVLDITRVNIGDSVLLSGQINANENGIYICTQTGDNFISTILQRRDDFHCKEQVRAGQYISISDGALNTGGIFSISSPLPVKFGIDPLFIVSSQPVFNQFYEAGTSVGSAGDPNHCNAGAVLQVVIRGAVKYIPLFDRNT